LENSEKTMIKEVSSKALIEEAFKTQSDAIMQLIALEDS
jgi:hypothetical protein